MAATVTSIGPEIPYYLLEAQKGDGYFLSEKETVTEKGIPYVFDKPPVWDGLPQWLEEHRREFDTHVANFGCGQTPLQDGEIGYECPSAEEIGRWQLRVRKQCLEDLAQRATDAKSADQLLGRMIAFGEARLRWHSYTNFYRARPGEYRNVTNEVLGCPHVDQDVRAHALSSKRQYLCFTDRIGSCDLVPMISYVPAPAGTLKPLRIVLQGGMFTDGARHPANWYNAFTDHTVIRIPFLKGCDGEETVKVTEEQRKSLTAEALEELYENYWSSRSDRFEDFSPSKQLSRFMEELPAHLVRLGIDFDPERTPIHLVGEGLGAARAIQSFYADPELAQRFSSFTSVAGTLNFDSFLTPNHFFCKEWAIGQWWDVWCETRNPVRLLPSMKIPIPICVVHVDHFRLPDGNLAESERIGKLLSDKSACPSVQVFGGFNDELKPLNFNELRDSKHLRKLANTLGDWMSNPSKMISPDVHPGDIVLKA